MNKEIIKHKLLQLFYRSLFSFSLFSLCLSCRFSSDPQLNLSSANNSRLFLCYSCCHAGHVVSIEQRSLDDYFMFPLHVYGVKASIAALNPHRNRIKWCYFNEDTFNLWMFFLQCVWGLFCWQTVPHTEGPSVEERSILCKSIFSVSFFYNIYIFFWQNCIRFIQSFWLKRSSLEMCRTSFLLWSKAGTEQHSLQPKTF